MPTNLEIKARVTDINNAKKIASSFHAFYGGCLRQTDTYFNVSQGRLKLREIIEGQSELIFYRRDEHSFQRVSTFEQYPAQNPHLLKSLLTKAYGIKGIVSKERELFLVNGTTRIHIDTVERLGMFIEFEVPVSVPSLARQELEILIKQFQIQEKDFLKPSYIDLLTLHLNDFSNIP